MSKRVFNSIGICGGGKMATGMFDYLLRLNKYDLVLYVRNLEKLQAIQNKYQRRLDKASGDSRKITFTSNLKDISNVDLVLEFISENYEAKKNLIKSLINLRENSAQIIATGTSSFKLSTISEQYAEENLFGIHFIYPIQFIKIAELVYGDNSDGGQVEKLKSFLIEVGKTPILLHEEIGNFTIRIMSRVNNEAFMMFIKQKIPPIQIDKLIEKEEILSPPFALTDSVGLDVIRNSIIGLYRDTNEFHKYTDLLNCLDLKIQNNELGKKSGHGFYNYQEKEEMILVSLTQEEEALIVNRIKLTYINACLKIMDGGWMCSKELDDYLKELYSSDYGPIEIAFDIGLKNVLEMLEKYSIQYDSYFNPPSLLRYAIEKGIGREEIDRQIRLFKMGGTRPDWYTENIEQAI